MEQSASFDARLAHLAVPEVRDSLVAIRRGVEREALRITPTGSLSTQPHPRELGSTLTHSTITTDFSEALLEFITPPYHQTDHLSQELRDIHRFVYQSIGDELLWPISMPCYLPADDQIPIARFGSSHVARMKEIYRTGLHHRYGSAMQAIAGVHFNFSFPEKFWPLWAELNGVMLDSGYQSEQYFWLIRNFRRYAWVIPYLFGASPALCSSFLAGKSHNFEFQSFGKGSLHLPYATALRLSDLGYTNSLQSRLDISYNSLSEYVQSVRAAVNTPAPFYQKFASGEGGEWQQLNSNILQIENELYSPIRPKQPTRSLEKPIQALADRGVEYIEVRALDVNPFSPIGIDQKQIDFIDVFLTTLLVLPSPKFSADAYRTTDRNLTRVALQGRQPGLTLDWDGSEVSLAEVLTDLFDKMAPVASIFDQANGTDSYSMVIKDMAGAIADPEQTLSGQWMEALRVSDLDNGALAMQYARAHQQQILAAPFQRLMEADFKQRALESIQRQREVEQSDQGSFDEFIRAYFAN